MSYKERENIVSLITTMLVTVPYLVFMYLRYQRMDLNTTDQLGFWATAVLIMVPIRIISEIAVSIIFRIYREIVAKDQNDDVIDERDYIIELKSIRNSYFIFVVGFMVSLVFASIGKSILAMFLVLIITGFISEIIGIITNFYYYNKGH